MTGAVEAASLALAVLPIVISVAENFSSAARALKRYRNFSLEVGHLSKLVRLQRTIFQGEIQSLLASCVGWDRAEQLLHNADQSGWDDKDLEESFVARLGNTREPFLELVQWINAELSEMEARLSGFEEVAQLAKEVGGSSQTMVPRGLCACCRATCETISFGGIKSEKSLASRCRNHDFKNLWID